MQRVDLRISSVYPVKTNVMGPMDLGIIPSAISYPASLKACLAIIEFR